MNNNWIIKNSPPVECGILGESLKFPSRNIYCVGRNYRDHAKEMGSDPDREQPFFFQKTSDVLVNDGSEIGYPKDTSNFQYEVELVVAISEEAFHREAFPKESQFVGGGCASFTDITNQLPGAYPRASYLLRFALQKLNQGDLIEPEEILPIYLNDENSWKKIK